MNHCGVHLAQKSDGGWILDQKEFCESFNQVQDDGHGKDLTEPQRRQCRAALVSAMASLPDSASPRRKTQPNAVLAKGEREVLKEINKFNLFAEKDEDVVAVAWSDAALANRVELGRRHADWPGPQGHGGQRTERSAGEARSFAASAVAAWQPRRRPLQRPSKSSRSSDHVDGDAGLEGEPSAAERDGPEDEGRPHQMPRHCTTRASKAICLRSPPPRRNTRPSRSSPWSRT